MSITARASCSERKVTRPQRAGEIVDGQFFGSVDRIRRRMDDALVGGTVSAIMLDEWEEATLGYGRQYMTVPPLRLLCDVLLDFGDVRRMSERRQALEFSERLCRLAGRLSGLIGMIMMNVGDQRLARSFFRTARTAAVARYLREPCVDGHGHERDRAPDDQGRHHRELRERGCVPVVLE